jgi:hypothetical protein
MEAIIIPEPKYIWSSIKNALTHVRRCIASLKEGKLSQYEISQIWELDANLTKRRHKRVALCLREVYWDIDSGNCPDVRGSLINLLAVLQVANIRRKQQLARKKAGISKGQ